MWKCILNNYTEKELKTISDCRYLQACPRLLQASMKSAFCFRASLKDSMASCKDTNMILVISLIAFQPIQGIIQHYFLFIPFPFTNPQGSLHSMKKTNKHRITSQRSQGCQIQTSLKVIHNHHQLCVVYSSISSKVSGTYMAYYGALHCQQWDQKQQHFHFACTLTP